MKIEDETIQAAQSIYHVVNTFGRNGHSLFLDSLLAMGKDLKLVNDSLILYLRGAWYLNFLDSVQWIQAPSGRIVPRRSEKIQDV